MLRQSQRLFVALATLLTAAAGSLPACSSIILVDGLEVFDNDYRQAEAAVIRRAAFELDCPAETIEVRALHAASFYVRQIGVVACGRRAVYIRRDGTSADWLLNSQPKATP